MTTNMQRLPAIDRLDNHVTRAFVRGAAEQVDRATRGTR